MENENRTFDNWKITLGLAVFGLGVSLFISYLSYFQALASPFNASLAFSSLLFWGVVLGLCFSFPLKGAIRAFLTYIKTARGVAVYVVYTSLHILVYGIILEAIVATIYPSLWNVPVQGGVVLSSQPLYPLTALTLLGNFFFNPNLAALVPPIFDISLSLYSILLAYWNFPRIFDATAQNILLRYTSDLSYLGVAILAGLALVHVPKKFRVLLLYFAFMSVGMMGSMMLVWTPGFYTVYSSVQNSDMNTFMMMFGAFGIIGTSSYLLKVMDIV